MIVHHFTHVNASSLALDVCSPIIRSHQLLRPLARQRLLSQPQKQSTSRSAAASPSANHRLVTLMKNKRKTWQVKVMQTKSIIMCCLCFFRKYLGRLAINIDVWHLRSVQRCRVESTNIPGVTQLVPSREFVILCVCNCGVRPVSRTGRQLTPLRFVPHQRHVSRLFGCT